MLVVLVPLQVVQVAAVAQVVMVQAAAEQMVVLVELVYQLGQEHLVAVEVVIATELHLQQVQVVQVLVVTLVVLVVHKAVRLLLVQEEEAVEQVRAVQDV
jgi:hypothetical protein